MYKINKAKEKPIGGYTNKYEEHIFELARASHIEVYNTCIAKANQHGNDMPSLLVSLMEDVGSNIKVSIKKNMKDGKLLIERKRLLKELSEGRTRTEKISSINAKIAAWTAIKTLVNEFQSEFAKKSIE